MKKIRIESESFLMPQCWGETTQEQKLALLPLQLVDLNETGDPSGAGRLKALALKVLLPGLGKYVDRMGDDQMFALGRLVKWVWSTKITEKPFESFAIEDANGRLVTYLLPEDNYANTSAIEIAMANIHYLAFTRPGKPNPLGVLALIATLCRPARADLKKFRKSVDWNNDAREEYNTVLAEERAVQFANLPFGVVMAITQYFEAMNGRFLKAYKDVYDPDPLAEDEPAMYHNGEGLVTTLMDIAKVGVFGDFEKVCKQNAHTVWLYLRDNSLKIKRANARAELQND
ncbi:hypothetical protein [Spirosoma endbachense]|uniref:Uncharacterized protein n=1 Tax=Spirosoma endbachense TaxID=2666025 RepID=A0A6P1VYT8_9BACT|nr:hypothetical protein [Spirosoma endbachense]QHV97945.1 hypothetical protein GJR95_24345 [Spirosoma endbachense]